MISKVKRKFKSVLCVVMCVSFMLLMTSCDVPDEAINGIDTVMNNRADANLNLAHNLMNAGFLTNAEYTALESTINTNIERILKQLEDDGDVKSTGNILLNAIVDWTCVPDCNETNPLDADGNPIETNSAFNTSFLANWMASKNFDSGVLVREADAIIKPIVIIDDKTAESLNARFHYPMYILNENVELDKAVAAIAQATSGTDVDVSLLSSYFHLLTDENGDPVTLIDSEDPANQLVQTSYTEGSRVDKENKVVNPLPEGIKWGYTTSHIYDDLSGCDWGLLDIYTNGYKGELGQDLVLTQHGYPTMAIRLVEFNQKAYDHIMTKLSLSEQKYLVTTTGSEGRVYVMEYPAGYINQFEYDSTTKEYDTKIMQSDLAVNLKTGKIYSNTTTPVEFDSIDPYLQLSGGTPDSSSFIIDGVTGVGAPSDGCWNLKFGDSQTEASVARIVLRDYLELSYAPDVIPNEKFVAYGRKIRIDKLRGSITTPMGYYVNKDGTRPVNADGTPASTSLYISDFSYVISATPGNKFYLKYIPSNTTETIPSSTEITQFEANLDTLADYDDSKLENLQKIAHDKVAPTLRFPGSSIDKVDYTMGRFDEKQVFYGMFISKDYTSSGLLNWLTSSDSTHSLKAWVTWLKEHRYNYPLDVNKAVEFLKKSYKYELSQSGIIILDLETIAKIQEGYDHDTNLGRTHTFRTIFKVLGYILIGYAALMLGCWTLDTTVDVGINSLEKVTFGRLIAIKDEDEMPQQDTKSKSYIGFQPIIKSCLVVAILGIVLILIDVVSIVGMLITLFSGIARYIGEFIGGL